MSAHPASVETSMSDMHPDFLAPLAAIGRAMQDTFDPHGFLVEFSTRLQPMLPHDRLLIAHREEGERLSIVAEHALRGPVIHRGRYTLDFDPGSRFAPADLLLESVLAGEPVLVRDFATDPRFAALVADPPVALRIGVRSRVMVPLASRGQIIGALLIGSYTPDTYAENHVARARGIADLIAPLIENVILLHREQRRRRRLAALGGLAPVFGASLNLAENFEQVAEAVRPALDFDVMGVRLLAESGRDMELVGRVSDAPGPASSARIPFDDLSFSVTVQAGTPVCIRDAQRELDPAKPGDRRILERGNRSLLSVPLRLYEQVGGVLFFGKRPPEWYDSSDVEIAQAIAAQVVMAAQHQRLAAEQQHRVQAEGRARHLEQHLSRLHQELANRYGFERIIGRAPALREALARAAKVAPTETTVLLTGESGTGKELVARAIHHASPRAEGPFVAVNCAALPETLVDSELFGHERGAFTGADKQKLGRFEVAAGGTLLLDEVGDLAPAVQAKLLRVLQEHEFQRVGGTATLRANVRLITATNRDLARAVTEGTFREDLFYRLNVFSVHLPPLRERGEDILLLAHHFVRELGSRIGRGECGISRDASRLLLAHRWPGNIRELQNAVERALIVAEGGLLTAAHFGLIAPAQAENAATRPSMPTGPRSLADVEKDAILAALERAKGNKARAAAALGITRTKLYTRLRQFGLPLD